MPLYNKTGFGPTPKQLVPRETSYLFGSWDYKSSPTKFQITNIALTTNVVTLTGYVREGKIPIAGNLISVSGTQGGSAALNAVNSVAITTVTIDATTGVGTIVFPFTSANIVSVADAGIANIPVAEVGETVVLNNASAPVTVDAYQQAGAELGRTVTGVCSFTTLPTSATVVLQGALLDIDSEYFLLGTTGLIGTVAGSALTVNTGAFTLVNVNFIRAKVTALSGTAVAIVKVV